MATKADKELNSLLGGGGGGKGKVPWWVKLGVFLVWELVLWAVSLDWPLFLVLTAFSVGLIWACFQDLGNVLMFLACLVFFTLLVGTSFGTPMRTVANGVRGFGDTGVSSVGNLSNSIPTATTTTAPPPPPASPAGAPR